MGHTPARVLVVEDDEPIRLALDAAFRQEGYITRAEADGSAIERVSAEFRPDLAVLDVRLPVGPDGCTLARRLRQSSDMPLIFVSAADGVDDRLAGFEAGGDDYLVKPFAMAELLARARVLLRRSGRLRPHVVQVGDLEIDETSATVTREGTAIPLRETEYRLLTFLAHHRGQVLSKHQLLDNVWGFAAFDPNRVEAQVSSLRRKLEAHGPRLIHTVRGIGYVLKG